MKDAVLLSFCLLLASLAVAQKPSPATLATPKAAAPAPVNRAGLLPVGTAIRMKLETPISTSRSNPGDVFVGRVTEPVTLEGRTVIPVGAGLQGRVIAASEPRRIRGTPTINLRPDVIIMPDGQRFAISASIVDTDQRPQTDVDDEGRIKGRGHDNGDLREAALGAGAGAGIGAFADGGHGALIGAAIGTTATVIHWLTKRKSAELPAGSEIIMELSRPMVISGKTGSK